MATNISTIGTASRDYSTIQLWEDATDTDLVTAGDIEVGECYNDGDFKASNIISGATTDSSNYRILRAASGEGHDGTFSGAGVKAFDSLAGTRVFTVLEDFFQVGSGMLIETASGVGSSDECIRVGDPSNNAEGLLVEKALIRNLDASTSIDCIYAGNYAVGTASNPITIRNCAVYGAVRAGVHCQNFSGTTDQYWNLITVDIVDCKHNIGYDTRSTGSLLTIKIIDVILGDDRGGTRSGDYVVTSASTQNGTVVTTGSANNYDEKTEVPAGTTMTLVTTPVSGVECVITSKYTNLKLVDDVDNDVLLQGVGNGDNGLVPTDDFIGNDRGTGSTCDPGCHQVSTPPSAGARNRAVLVN